LCVQLCAFLHYLFMGVEVVGAPCNPSSYPLSGCLDDLFNEKVANGSFESGIVACFLENVIHCCFELCSVAKAYAL